MSIVDRAARALLKAQSGTDDWDGLDAELQETLREEARAVLRAIREPTDGMLEAAFNVDIEFRTTMGNLNRGFCDGDGVWQAMIDHALG